MEDLTGDENERGPFTGGKSRGRDFFPENRGFIIIGESVVLGSQRTRSVNKRESVYRSENR